MMVTSPVIEKRSSNQDVLYVKKDNGRPISINMAEDSGMSKQKGLVIQNAQPVMKTPQTAQKRKASANGRITPTSTGIVTISKTAKKGVATPFKS